MTDQRLSVVASRREFSTDSSLLAKALAMYKPHCRYVKQATVCGAPDTGTTARCELAITEPGHDDGDVSGHLNSDQFVVCRDQMHFYAVAKSVSEGLMEPFGSWDLDDFWALQRTDLLVAEMHAAFKRPVRSDRFFGEIRITDVRERDGSDGRRPLILVNSETRFWDDHGGHCHGSMRAVVTRPPGTVRR